MSYSTKYRMEWASSSGAMQVDIQPDGYTGDVLRLTPAAEPLAIEWGNQNERDLSLPLLESVAFLGFKGDSTGQQVEEVLNAGPFEYRVVARQDSAVIWQGFVTADEWANNPRNQEEKIELEADDGLKLLTELTAEESLSQGAEKNVWDLIRSALSRLHDLPYSVGMEWYPYRDGNQLGANTQPLERLSVPDTYLADQLTERGTLEVDAGKINERLILEDLVERFGMRAFLSDGEWWLRQRTQVDPSTGAYKRWVWDGANGTFLSPSSFDATQTLPPKRRREKPRQGVPRLSSVSSTYEYDRLGNLVGNPGFENALTQWGQTEPVYDFTDGTTVASDVSVITHSTSNTGRDPTQSDGSALEISVGVTEKDSGDQADITDLPEATFTGLDVFDAGPRGGIQLDLEFGYPFLPGGNQNAQSGAYVELEVGGKYLKRGDLNARADAPESDTEEGTIPIDDPASAISEATQDGVVVIPEGATLPVLGTGSASKIDVSAPVRVGDTVIRGETDGDIDRTADIRFWYWTTSQNQLQDENTGDGVSDFPVPVTDLPNMEGQTLRASQRTPAGDPVTGDLAIRLQLFIAPNEFETAVLYDNVSLQILQQGEIVDQTQFVASTGAVGESRSLTHRTGDGPSPQHELGLVLQGKNKPTQDWQVGPYSSGDPRSGQNLEELSALELLASQRRTVNRRQRRVELRGEDVWPHHVFEVDGSLYDVSYMRRVWAGVDYAEVELAELRDDGRSGVEQTFRLESDRATTAPTSSATGGGGGTPGGGVSRWDGLTGELSGPVPFDATDDDGTPTSRSLRFLNVTPQVDVTSDPANGIALEIKDQTNGTRLGTLTTDGRWETRADQEAFADGSFGSGSSTNSLLQVEDAGTVLTTDAASIDFTGSGVNVSVNGDDVTVEVSGGSGSDIDIEDNQSVVVGGATGLSFEGSGVDSVNNDGDGTATVNISKGSSTEIQEGGTAQVSDVTVLDFIGSDFNVDNPNSGEAEVGLQDDTVTVAGNAVSLGGTTGIAHGDLSSIGSSDHHAKTTSAADLTDVSADSVTDAHHTRPSAGDGLSESSNTFSVNEAQVDHDSLNQFVANEHVDHSAVTISAGTALSGGGDLTASRTLNVAGPFTGIPFKTSGDNLEWQADANNDLILQNTTDSQTLLKVDQDTGTVFAAGDVVAFGLSGGGGSGSTSGLQADAPLTLDTTTDPDTIGLSVGSGLTVTNGTLEADGSVGVSSVFGRTGDVTASSGDYSHGQISGISSDDHHTRYSDEEAQDAVGTILTGSGAASVSYDDGGNIITISATDTNTQLSDSEVQTAINNDPDHGSTASHNYFSGNYSDLSGTPSIAYNSTIPADDFTSTEVSNLRSGQLDDGSTPWASNNFFDAGDARSAVEGTSDVADLVGGLGTSGQVPQTDGTNVSWVTLAAADISGVSPDSDADAHHAVFEPADYNPVSDVETHGNALAIDITGDADTLDGVEGSNYARTDVNEFFSGKVGINTTSIPTGRVFAVGQAGDQVVIDGTTVKSDASTAFFQGSNDIKVAAGNDIILQTNASAVATVTSGGNFGIGTSNPSYALEVIGDARATGEVEAFLGSDRRLKTGLDPLDSALDKVDKLTGYNFDWRNNDSVMPHKRGNTDIGVIAQEVEQVLPNAVKEFEDGHSKGYKSVSYDKLVPLLIEAIKDLRSQIEQLR